MSAAVRRSRPSSAGPAGRNSTGGASYLSHVSTAVPLHGSLAASNGVSPSSSSSLPASLAGRPRAGDAEQLSAELQQLKATSNTAQQENANLKTQLQRLIGALRKKDKQIDQLLALKIADASASSSGGSGSDAIVLGQLRELKSEMSTIARISSKCRELELEATRREEEMRRLRATLKCTMIQELEIESQTYYNEARRMKKAMQLLQQQNAQLQQQLEKQKQEAEEEAADREAAIAAAAAAHAHLSPPRSALSSSSTARDHEYFNHLRNEVATLRAENLALRSAQIHVVAGHASPLSSRSRSPSRVSSSRRAHAAPPLSPTTANNAHVLSTLQQLQYELQTQIATEQEEQQNEEMEEEDEWADRAEYTVDEQPVQQAPYKPPPPQQPRPAAVPQQQQHQQQQAPSTAPRQPPASAPASAPASRSYAAAPAPASSYEVAEEVEEIDEVPEEDLS